MNAHRPLRTAVIGYGLGGQVFHAPFLSALPEFELAAVVTGNPERYAEVRRRYPSTEVIGTAEEVFARAGEFDLVVVAAPNGQHYGLARDALLADLHVVVDKPLAGTPDQGRELFELAGRRGRVLQAYQNRRWDGDFQTVRNLVRRDALGEVLRFESRFERWRPSPKSGWKEDADPAALGGILYDLGSHVIDQAVVLFGRPRRVYAEMDVRRAGAVTDDDVFVALTQNGRSGGADAGPVRSHLWMSAAAADQGPRMRVLGSRAAYVTYGMDGQEERLRAGETPAGAGWGEVPESRWGTYGNATDGRSSVRTAPGGYQRFYQGLSKALWGAGALPVPVEDTVTVLEVLAAVQESARTGQVVGM